MSNRIDLPFELYEKTLFVYALPVQKRWLMLSSRRASWFFVSFISCLLLAACGEEGDLPGGGTALGDLATANSLDLLEIPNPDFGESGSGTVGDDTSEEGGFGWPCLSNSDCESGYCIESFEGFICTKTCIDDCPEDFSCKSVINTYPDIVFICVADVLKICQPCKNDSQCAGGRCVDLQGEGQFCTSYCNEGNPCPEKYECTELTTSGSDDPILVCLPTDGTCECSSESLSKVRGCQKNNEIGTCYGYEFCDDGGWTDCTATTPSEEICDGIDNDCNGKLDENVGDGEPCSIENEYGICSGIQSCLAVGGLVCSADPPAAESCDYIDNDCDGDVDEDFKNAEGKYNSQENCGQCGKDCENAIANAVAKCDSGTLETPQCVVEECELGFYKLNGFICSPVPPSLCQKCKDDSTCFIEGAKCISLPEGNYCSVPCETGLDCPPAYSCQEQEAGGKQCIPDTGSCSCDGSDLSLQKGCEKVWQDPNDPAAPVVTCPGILKCTKDGWSQCFTGPDICDGIDNDCDGIVDGPWIDINALYNQDDNCGVCANSCSAKDYPNAKGTCDTSSGLPQCTVTCDEGFFDVNNNPNDGCECAFQSTADHPDGDDQNCDGIDGEVKNGIFVAKTGNDLAEGTLNAPMLTIQAGIDSAAAQGKRDVYVATGVYSTSIKLKVGVAVYGGYSGDFFQRNVTLYETAILGQVPTLQLPGAVNAYNIQGNPNALSVLAGFTVFGFNNKAPGGTTYGIWIANCDNQLHIRNNIVLAGDGGNGTLGIAGLHGKSGKAGTAGQDAYDVGGDNCSTKHYLVGGNAGSNSCSGGNVSGGDGGTAVCPDYDINNSPPACPAEPYEQVSTLVETGQKGNGAGAGKGGSAGFDAYIDKVFGPYNSYSCKTAMDLNCTNCLLPAAGSKQGKPGHAGQDGADALSGGGCLQAAGQVTNHLWSSLDGENATSGTHGGGGGGGGAAGGVETVSCKDILADYDDIGGSGGGGGSGGCGGTKGTGGEGGGGSFGVFISWSLATPTGPVVMDNDIILGSGGLGGHGGPSGTGGGGGSAGNGGAAGNPIGNDFCATTGGNGGPGGRGGHGGGGGGGCGGVSYGIFVNGGAGQQSWKDSNNFTELGGPGLPGLGGASLGAPGTDGKTGNGDKTNF